MPEGNFLTPNPVNVKKPKRKVYRKSAKGAVPVGRQGSASGGKKPSAPPFKINEKMNIKPPMPKASYRIPDDEPIKNKSENKSLLGKLAFTFVALTAILVLAVMYFGFSKTTIIIIPTREKIADNLNVEIVDQAINPSLGQGPDALVGTRQVFGVVKQVPVEQAKIFTVSGKEVLGQEVTGKITIINHYLKNQPLVASTRFLSQGNKLFRLKNTVNVPAGGRVEAEVYADEAKPDMAIGPSRFTIPGLWAGLQDKIYAESQAAMKYSEKAKYIISQSDMDNAVSELKSSLLASAKEEVGRAYSEYDQTLLAVDNNSVSQEVNGKVGEEKEKFSIKMKTLVTVVAFKDDDIYNQAQAKLAATLADDKVIAEFSKQNLSYRLGNLNLSQGTAAVSVDFSAKVTLKDGAKIIKKNNLTGLNFEQLKAYLNNLPEVAGYEIKFFPSFIKKTPNLVDRIEIQIKK